MEPLRTGRDGGRSGGNAKLKHALSLTAGQLPGRAGVVLGRGEMHARHSPPALAFVSAFVLQHVLPCRAILRLSH
jgi:hypothetical protein